MWGNSKSLFLLGKSGQFSLPQIVTLFSKQKKTSKKCDNLGTFTKKVPFLDYNKTKEGKTCDNLEKQSMTIWKKKVWQFGKKCDNLGQKKCDNLEKKCDNLEKSVTIWKKSVTIWNVTIWGHGLYYDHSCPGAGISAPTDWQLIFSKLRL